MFNIHYSIHRASKNSLLAVVCFILIFSNISFSQIPQATSGFQFPLIGAYSNNGGYTFQSSIGGNQFHPGEDWNQPTLNGGCGTGCDIDMCLDVVATANGQVKYVNTSSGSWCGIVIQHNYQGQTWYSQYGHIINIEVVNGQNVTKGQKIAEIGKNQTDCAHLHFEIRESDHPNPTLGTYYSNLTYSNVENWYEDPDSFIPSHPAYNTSLVNCTFSVNSNYSLNLWKFWKKPPMPANFYNVTMHISGLTPGSNWSLYILHPNGSIISDVRTNRPESLYTFEFHVDSGSTLFPNLAGYRFRLTPNGLPNTTWVLSDPFYISDPPTLNISIAPFPVIYIGNNATLNWTTSGGIPGLPNGGWTGNIRFQWYQNGVPKPNLDSVLVSLGTYTFVVPSSIQGATVPGTNFQIGAANADVGSSMPGGLVSKFTQNFSIQNTLGLTQNLNEIPSSYGLFQNYPNPFNPLTNIKFDLPEVSDVSLILYGLDGKEISKLVEVKLEAGSYTYQLDGFNLSSGVYIYTLKAGDFIDTKKMILLK